MSFAPAFIRILGVGCGYRARTCFSPKTWTASLEPVLRPGPARTDLRDATRSSKACQHFCDNSAFDHDRSVEQDRLSWLRSNGDLHRPDSRLGNGNSADLPQSRPRALWHSVRVPGGSAAAVRDEGAPPLPGKRERSSRITRIATWTDPGRPGSMVTSAMASGAWM